jgi:hypothetical protein
VPNSTSHAMRGTAKVRAFDSAFQHSSRGGFLLAPRSRRKPSDEPPTLRERGPDLSGGMHVLTAFLRENPATDAHLRCLAEDVGSDISTLRELEVGHWPSADAFLVPERNHLGQIVGLQRLYRDGARSVLRGSVRGLIMPSEWAHDAEEIFIAAGLENVAALRGVGVNAIAVPPVLNRHPAYGSLLPLLAGSMKCRAVVADASYEAEAVAERLAFGLYRKTGFPVAWAVPLQGFETAAEQIKAGEWHMGLGLKKIFHD